MQPTKHKKTPSDINYVPTSSAELLLATEPDGLAAILPKKTENLEKLRRRNAEIKKFDLELAYDLQRLENLLDLDKAIKQAIKNNRPVTTVGIGALPLFRRTFHAILESLAKD